MEAPGGSIGPTEDVAMAHRTAAHRSQDTNTCIDDRGRRAGSCRRCAESCKVLGA